MRAEGHTPMCVGSPGEMLQIQPAGKTVPAEPAPAVPNTLARADFFNTNYKYA